MECPNCQLENREEAAFCLECGAELGLLYKAKKRTAQAKEFILKAIEIFEQCETEVFMQQARETLASLD